MFQKATKQQSKLRLALVGPSGSGKTYTALKIATELAGPQGRIAVIDTEHGSAAKYADEFNFDTVSLTEFHPDKYVACMREAHRAKYDVLIIDSISHAWDAVLELVDQAARRSKSGNSYTAWREGTPVQNAFIQAMLKYGGHIIATMRAKTEYVIETNERGKQAPRKVGMAPVQRAGVEYEFDVVGELDYEHNFVVSKTRCRQLDQVVIKNAEGVAATLAAWLGDGAPVPESGPPPQAASFRPSEPTADDEIDFNSPPPKRANAPQTTSEARQRFFDRFGDALGGRDWKKVLLLMGDDFGPEPVTVTDWMDSGRQVAATLALRGKEAA